MLAGKSRLVTGLVGTAGSSPKKIKKLKNKKIEKIEKYVCMNKNNVNLLVYSPTLESGIKIPV